MDEEEWMGGWMDESSNIVLYISAMLLIDKLYELVHLPCLSQMEGVSRLRYAIL